MSILNYYGVMNKGSLKKEAIYLAAQEMHTFYRAVSKVRLIVEGVVQQKNNIISVVYQIEEKLLGKNIQYSWMNTI